ncbi:MAG: hypothetical protein KatS3mg057_1511 [Herpetosiphonaceae bacterium]|nr:MAG: hypothetical protein KatS3mg057_1511 [Herpetosiphonaceae bacterium]
MSRRSVLRIHLTLAFLLAIAALLPSQTIALPEEHSSPPTGLSAILAGCAEVKPSYQSAPVARWLEDCGTVDPRGDPELVARMILAGRAQALGLRPDGRDLDLLATQVADDVVYVRFQQTHKGVPVYLGQVLVQYGRAGDVQLINNHTLPNLNVEVAPAVDGDTALNLALASVPGADNLRAPPQRRLVIYGEHGAPELAWHIVLYTAQPPGDWHVMISARSGKLLGAWDEIWNDDGHGLAYTPNPVQQTGDDSLRDDDDHPNTALNAARLTVDLNNLDSSTFKLKGSYVDVTSSDVSGCSLPYTPGMADESSRVYNYDRGDDRFEEVTVYAAIDGAQMWFQSLGLTNVNNRAVPVNVHCTAADNSFFSRSDGALHFGDGGVDDAEDADIVLHEYGHSIQDHQVPGWGPGSNTEQRAMGEGFGDFLAGLYYIDSGDSAFLSAYRYCIGEWDAASYNPIVPDNPGSGCLRWIDGRSERDGSDIGVYKGSPVQEHDDGRYWSAMLTCVYEGMGAGAAARDDLMGVVLAHHFSLAPDSSDQAFEDAVDALLLADRNRLDGAHQDLIRDCAIERGLIQAPVLAAPTLTYPVGGERLMAGRTVTVTWHKHDAPADAVYTLEYTTECVIPADFADDAESGPGEWSISHNGGILDWSLVTNDSHSPEFSWFAGNEASINDQYLVSPPVTINSGAVLSFWHRYDLEQMFDGGVVEVSLDNGLSWGDVGPLMVQNGYNERISLAFGSPIAGREAFSGNSEGWIRTLVDLSGYAGQTIRIRFRQADDSDTAEVGWWVDDIALGRLPVWTKIGASEPGADSFEWNTPAMPGVNYCLRIKGSAPGYQDSEYDTSEPFELLAPHTVWLMFITK